MLAEQDHGGFGSGICRIGHRARVCDVSVRLGERSALAIRRAIRLLSGPAVHRMASLQPHDFLTDCLSAGAG
ncbi:hypothetical protein GFS60_04353 [Rhodococcus sp. WAY2]|nr:hypothetical protein GFS60_04353 [Rhodococcus sp. WAY2]